MHTPSDQPITIVSGLPRSGTSMMMQMLEAGGVPILCDGVRAADQDNPEGYLEFEPAKRTKDDPSWLASARGKAVKAIYALLYDLPSDHTYRIIFMQRPLDEVVASQQAMLERTGKQGAATDTARLAGIFRRELERTEQWLAGQENMSVCHVSYHDVLADPGGQCAAVAEFLGGGLDTSAMASCVRPSLHRQKAASPAQKQSNGKRPLLYGLAAVVLLAVGLGVIARIVGDSSDGPATPKIDNQPTTDDNNNNDVLDEEDKDRLEGIPYL